MIGRLQYSITAVDDVQDHITAITACAQRIADALRTGHKVLWFGNGGSAAMAQHLSAELTGRFARESPPWASIALTADTAALTAIANDYGYDYVFRRQVSALANPGDVAVGMTTSGRSQNVINGIDEARSRGCATLVLSGPTWSPGSTFTRVLRFDGFSTAQIQEAHLVAGHLMVGEVERLLCND